MTGSHATIEHYPRSCAVCGERVKVTGDESLTFYTGGDGLPLSYHSRCRKQAADLARPCPPRKE